MIDLTVKTLDSQNHAFSLDDDITVKQFKDRIAETINIPASTQRLIYCGRVLQDEKLLNEYDVNGKVIHLVQRAPPSVSQRSSSNTSQNQGEFQNASGGGGGGGDWPRFHYRQTQFHGNPMYVGSVSFPTDVLGGYEWISPQPSNTSVNRHLTVIRRMLDQANRIIDRLDNPTSSNDATSENTSTQPEETQPAAAETEPDDERSDMPVSGVNIALARVHNDGTLEPILVSMNSSQSNETDQQQQRPQQQQQSQSQPGETSQQTGDISQQPAESSEQSTTQNNRDESLIPHELAELLENLLTTQDRLKPYIRDKLLAARNSSGSTSVETSAEENQRIIDSVTECFHCLSHAQHALSNLNVNMLQGSPRTLRCRPMAIQTPPIIQAGLPIQVEAHISLHGQNDNSTNNGDNNSSSRTDTQPTETPTSTSTETSTSETASMTAPQSQPTSDQQNTLNEPQQQPQSNSPLGAIFNISNNVEVVMEMGSQPPRVWDFSSNNQNRSFTNNNNANNTNNNNNENENNRTTSTTTTTTTTTNNNNQNNNNNNSGNNTNSGSGQNNSGIPLSWVAAQSPDLIRNFVQVVAGYMAQSGGVPTSIPIPSTSTTTPPGSIRRRTVAVAVGESPSPGQNSQTRGSTETHPTTSTQTRTTPRTHMLQHAQALGVGLGLPHHMSFDPLLPCTSYHIRRTQSSSTSTAASTQTGRLNRSTATQVSTQSQTATTSTRPHFIGRHVQLQDTVGSNTPLNESIASAARRSTDENPVPLNCVLLSRGVHLYFSEIDMRRESKSRGLVYLICNMLGEIPIHVWMSILRGNFGPLMDALVRLHQDISMHYRNRNSFPTRRVTNDICMELRPHLNAVFGTSRITDHEGRVINIRATIEELIRKYVKQIAQLIAFSHHTTKFQLGRIFNQFGTELVSILRYTLSGDFLLTTTRFARSVTSGLPPVFCEWVLQIAGIWFYSYSRRVTLLSDSQINALLIYESGTSLPAATSSDSSVPLETIAEPMEVDTASNDQPAEDPLLDNEEVPTTFPGHTNLLPDWVPIIARDGARQRRQLQLGLSDNNITTFSDAYLSTMPSKRRKLVEQQKPSLLVSPTPNHSVISASMERLVRESIGRAGVEEVDGAIAALVAEPTVRRAFGQAIRESLNPPRYETLDFPNPSRFPNATKFFTDSNRPPK